MTFNPSEHLIQLKGKDYLETKWRLVWFREEHPKGQVITELVNLSPVIYKATIISNDGGVLGTGHGSAVAKAGAVWAGREIEKAETAAIGRALGHAGYGTQFTDEDETDNLADSPVARKPSNGNHAPPPAERPTTPPSQNGNGSHAGDKPAQPKNAAPAQPVVKGDTKIEALKGVIAEEYIGKGNKKAVRFVTSTGSYSYTRQPFRDAGLDTEQWTKAGNSYTFDGPFNVISVWHQPEDPKAQGYWKIDRLEPIDQPLERFPAPEGARDIPF